MSIDKDIRTTKIFISICIAISLLLLAVAYLSPRNIHISEEIYIKSTPEQIIETLRDPANFRLWNPWQSFDTSIVYSIGKDASGQSSKLYWQSPTHSLSKGHLFYEKKDSNRIIIDADLAEQTQGTFEFTAYKHSEDSVRLRLDFTIDLGYDPIKRIHGFLIPYYFRGDMKNALKLLKATY